MSRPVRDRSRDRVLGDAEIRAIWDGLPRAPVSTDTADVLRLMLLTGQRKGEILLMEWSHLAEDGTWNLPPEITKNARSHAVPLPPMALAIIERRRSLRSSDQFVFAGTDGKPIRGGSVDHAVSRWANPAVAKAQVLAIPHWTPHDIRRSVETKLAALGVGETARKKLLNHVRDRITETYDRHDHATEKRAALMMLESELRRILGQNVAPLRKGQRARG